MFAIQGFLTCQSKLPMNYKNLSRVERHQIYSLMQAGHSQTQIFQLLCRDKSTISRGFKGYKSKQACDLSTKRSKQNRNAATVPMRVSKQPIC